MKYETIQNILNTTDESQWIRDEETLIFKEDVNLRLVIGLRRSTWSADPYNGNKHTGDLHEPTKESVDVYYNATLVTSFPVVCMDEGRYYMPATDGKTYFHVSKNRLNRTAFINDVFGWPDYKERFEERLNDFKIIVEN